MVFLEFKNILHFKFLIKHIFLNINHIRYYLFIVMQINQIFFDKIAKIKI